MPRQRNYQYEVDAEGRLLLPSDLAERWGLVPGARGTLNDEDSGLLLRRPPHHLARVNLEPTNQCNLDCRTCMRNVWQEPAGWMSEAVFAQVLASIESIHPRPMVFFGGYGEPLAHPKIIEMVARVRALGAPVELITNGILLDEDRAAGLLAADLDRLWVSIDGASPEAYADVRLGAALPQVIGNVERLMRQRDLERLRPRLGVAFVAMRRSIADLPDVARLAVRLGADRLSVSNVLAHDAQLRSESIYDQAQYQGTQLISPFTLKVDMPRMDPAPEVLAVLGRLLGSSYRVSWGGSDPGRRVNVCPFIEKGSLSVRWDGKVVPCLPLLHSHASLLDDTHRQSAAHVVGDLGEHSLLQIWAGADYAALRERLEAFDFSPCVFCNSCEFAEKNEEDCFGSPAPACGGCLWAQGLIQCP